MGRKKGQRHQARASIEGLQAPPPSHAASIGLLVLAGLLWHGLLLTNDGTIWDSWYVQNWLVEKNWRALNDFFGSVGMPIYGWLYAPFAFSPDIVTAFMIATVACLLAQAVMTYFLAINLGGLNSREAFCLALIAQAMPIFTAAQDYIMFFFVFMHALFLLASLVCLRSLELSGWRHVALRTAAVLMFFVSFYNAALLVFYGGFFLLLFFKWKRDNAAPFFEAAWRFGIGHADLLFLPPVAWVLRSIFTPQFGWYETYNSPVENIPLILPSLQSFFVNVLPFHTAQLGQWIAANPAIVALLLTAVVVAALRGPKSWSVRGGKVVLLPMIGFGVLLLFLAIFPFAAAGKVFSPRPIGEPSRYTILTGLPFAILIFGVLRSVLMPKPGTTSRWLAPVCVALAVVLGCQIPPVYVAERVEWIFSRSILHNARKNNEVRNSSVIVLQNCGMTSEIIYGIYAFASVFGDFSRLVTPTVPQNRQFFTPSEIAMTLYRTTMLPNTFNSVSPAGQQVLLVAERNRGTETDWQLARTYLRLRLLGKPGDIDVFLERLTSLKTGILKPSTQMVPGLAALTAVTTEVADTVKNSVGMEMLPVAGDWRAAKTETTQAQFEAVMGSNPSLFRDPLRPVESVSWNEAVEFCRKISDIERKAGRLPEGFSFRLPTLKESELIAADTSLEQGILASDRTHWQTQQVASRKPNHLGLYDVVGNVWEWTADPAGKGNRMRLLFGGSFANYPGELVLHPNRNETMDFFSRVVVSRLHGPTRRDYPDQAFWDRGFRVVLARDLD